MNWGLAETSTEGYSDAIEVRPVVNWGLAETGTLCSLRSVKVRPVVNWGLTERRAAGYLHS